MDWEGLHQFARKQSLLGVVFRGVCRAGESGARPPRALMMQWVAESEQIRKRNLLLNEAAAELSQRFALDGFRSCILKGQGNALMYPDPYSRTSGDIDIWLEGGRRKVLAYVRQSDPGAHLQYHHVDYPPVRGVGVEVHFFPSFFHNPLFNRRLQDYYRLESEAQFSNRTELPDGAGRVCVPTDGLNRVFQMTHILHHLVDEGVGLRQLMDYYYLLESTADTDREKEAALIGRLGMTRFAGGLMYALGELLGLPRERMSVAPDERTGRMIVEEILQGGNFGRYDERRARTAGRPGYLRQMCARILRIGRILPGEMLCVPLFLAWHQAWKVGNRLRVKSEELRVKD